MPLARREPLAAWEGKEDDDDFDDDDDYDDDDGDDDDDADDEADTDDDGDDGDDVDHEDDGDDMLMNLSDIDNSHTLTEQKKEQLAKNDEGISC